MAELQLFGVAGRPVFHSRSPDLFDRAFAAASFPGVYLRLATGRAADAADFLRELGLRGLNVTAPLKAGMAEAVDELDPDAAAIGAVNAVVFDGERTKGYNTDHVGVVRALKASGIGLAGGKCVVLGAGGAGRAAAYGLKNEGALVTIVNRTPERARSAARDFGCEAGRIEDLSALLRSADVLVSAISADATPVEAGWLKKGTAVLDARYPASSLLETAARRGCRVVEGKEWLFHQALPAFRLFTGLEPPERAMAGALAGRVASGRKTRNVSLVGFMGSGKSAVAARLAPLLGLRLADIDRTIEEKEGVSVSEIFRRAGEARFREAERAEIRRLAQSGGWVAACGGGSVLDAQNRRLLAENSTVVWLHCSLEACLARIDPGTRPLLEGGDAKRAAASLMKARRPHYARLSDLVVRNEEEAQKTAAIIHAEIRSSFEN
jgi:shikimate dehydrogenase